MTPGANTIYTVCLFFSLASLLKWTGRRDLSSLRLVRATAATPPTGNSRRE
jgi:hypothetical protein